MSEEVRNDWTSIIKSMAESAGLSQRQLSARMGRAPTYVSACARNYDKGQDPKVGTLMEMAAACGYELHLTGHGRDFLIRP